MSSSPSTLHPKCFGTFSFLAILILVSFTLVLGTDDIAFYVEGIKDEDVGDILYNLYGAIVLYGICLFGSVVVYKNLTRLDYETDRAKFATSSLAEGFGEVGEGDIGESGAYDQHGLQLASLRGGLHGSKSS